MTMMYTKPKPQPPVITIVGMPGGGKTTLGGLFPEPVFIQAENSETIFEEWENPPAFMPQLNAAKRNGDAVSKTAFDQVMDQLRWLATNEHDRKTLVVDSASALDRLFTQDICVEENVSNLGEAAGGYGKGDLILLERHTRFRQACEHLRKAKGMTLVFLSHSAVQKVKSGPDADEYMVHTLEVSPKSVPVYVNFSDCVLYIRKDEIITGKETDKKGRVTKFGKVMNTGLRSIVTTGDGRVGYVNAKTRYAMPADIAFKAGENPLLEHIPFLRGGVTDIVNTGEDE